MTWTLCRYVCDDVLNVSTVFNRKVHEYSQSYIHFDGSLKIGLKLLVELSWLNRTRCWYLYDLNISLTCFVMLFSISALFLVEKRTNIAKVMSTLMVQLNLVWNCLSNLVYQNELVAGFYITWNFPDVFCGVLSMILMF